MLCQKNDEGISKHASFRSCFTYVQLDHWFVSLLLFCGAKLQHFFISLWSRVCVLACFFDFVRRTAHLHILYVRKMFDSDSRMCFVVSWYALFVVVSSIARVFLFYTYLVYDCYIPCAYCIMISFILTQWNQMCDNQHLYYKIPYMVLLCCINGCLRVGLGCLH